jgi:NADPH:quinone reductase-like Zn-dependent oxidoreductase
MKVWQCDDLRPVPGLVSAEVKTPQPGRGEVLIRVHAFVEPNRQQLCDIAALLDAGQLRPVVGATVPFAQAAVVYAREPVHNRRPGKTVVTLIPPS